MNKLSEMQQTLLQVFKVFAKLCKDNGITYYAAYGTLIGAIRHHGFIPWDDDIDVYMKREDYDKFLALQNSLKDAEYHITSVLDGQSPYPFAKFYSAEGTIWEYRHFPFIIGPWIDVFPIDEGCEEDKKSNEAYNRLHYLMWKYRKSLADITWKQVSSDFIHFNVYSGIINIVKKCRYAPFKDKYLTQIKDCINDIKSIHSKDLRIYPSGKSLEIYGKSLFNEAISVPFEDTEILVPNGYHEVLTAFFGDYMQLPPEDKRKASAHNCFFIDLKHRKTREEILEETKGRNEQTTSLSLRIIIDEIKHRKKGFEYKH